MVFFAVNTDYERFNSRLASTFRFVDGNAWVKVFR